MQSNTAETPVSPPESTAAPRRRRLFWFLLCLLLLVLSFSLIDTRLRHRILGPQYNGIPLVAWQEFFVQPRDKVPSKVGWWRTVHEALVHDAPDEGRWRNLSAESRRDIVLSLDERQPEFVRQRIVMTLQEAPDSPELRARLREFRGDPNSGTRLLAARALHKHEPAATDFVEDLLIVMEDDRGFVAQEVCDVLAKIGRQAPEAVVPALLHRIMPDGKVSHAALIVVAGMGTLAKEAEPTLLQLVNSGDWQIRALAVQALGRMGTKEAAARVLARLTDRDPTVQREAMLALPALGAEAKPAIPMLLARAKALKPGDAMYLDPTELLVLGRMGEHAAAKERKSLVVRPWRGCSDEVVRQ